MPTTRSTPRSTPRRSRRRRTSRSSVQDDSGPAETWTKIAAVCSVYCVGRKRARPSLACTRCGALFHPECVLPPPALKHLDFSVTPFVCASCDETEPVAARSPDKQLWVQCDLCAKWRKLPETTPEELLPERWFCYLHPVLGSRSCTIPQEAIDEEGDEACEADSVSDDDEPAEPAHSGRLFRLHDDTLAHVLSFLDMAGLSAASQACRQWYHVARDHGLWRKVDVGHGYQIADWVGTTEHLAAHRCCVLDLSSFDLQSRRWSNPWLCVGLSRLQHLRELRLPIMTPDSLQEVCQLSNLQSLTTLEALRIEDPHDRSSFRIGSLSRLRALKRLRLASKCGFRFELPEFSFSSTSCLHGLEQLTALEMLQMVPIDVADADVQCLEALVNLRALSWSCCSGWDQATFKVLSGLKKLECLRLDDPGYVDVGLSALLCELPCLRRLDLHYADLSADFFVRLAHSNIETLYWAGPMSTEQVALSTTTILEGVERHKGLKQFIWAVTCEFAWEEMVRATPDDGVRRVADQILATHHWFLGRLPDREVLVADCTDFYSPALPAAAQQCGFFTVPLPAAAFGTLPVEEFPTTERTDRGFW